MVRFGVKLGIVIASLAVFSFGSSLGAAAPNQSSLQATDKVSPPGCLVIVGESTPPTCLPCPPLWLGGPTIRCVARLPSAVGSFTRTRDDRDGGFWFAACAGVPLLPPATARSRLNARLGGTGFAGR